MLKTPYELLIFDWDGTLVDSANEIVEAIQQSIAAMGLPQREDASVRRLIGLGLEQAFGLLFPDKPMEELMAVAEEYRRRFRARTPVFGQAFAGVEETLDQLAGQQYQLAVATGKSRRGLDKALHSSQWHSRFVATRCADETAGKPHPLMLQQLLDELELKPHQALMIGDTSYDMEMAGRAGMDAVAVGWGVHAANELEAAGALTVFPGLTHLPTWLGNREAGLT